MDYHNCAYARNDQGSMRKKIHALRMCPVAWQNQYELTQDSVPDSMRTLLPILETIEKCTEDRKDKPSKSVNFAAVPTKDNKRRKEHPGNGRIPKKAKSEKFCALCKEHGGASTTHNTTECRQYYKDGNPKKGTSKNRSEKKPYKKAESSFAQLSERFEKLEKIMKKSLKSPKKKRSHRDISSDSDSE